MKRKSLNVELAKISEADLKAKSVALAEELMKLRFRHATRQLDKTSSLRQVRRDLARTKTALSQKALATE